MFRGHPLSNRFLTLLLAAALAHQLGACPCGCWDGNLWVQQASVLWGNADEQPVAPTPDQHRADHGCENSPPLLYCAEAHGAVTAAGVSEFENSPLQLLFVPTPAVGRLSLAALHAPAGGSPPPPPPRCLQVEFQIFLI